MEGGDLNGLDVRSGEAINDLMDRYGSSLRDLAQVRSRDIQEQMPLENAQRLLALNMGLAEVIDEARRISEILQTHYRAPPNKRGLLKSLEEENASKSEVLGTLRVTVVKADNLPKMDYFRACDGYCVLWIDHGPNAVSCVTSVVPHNPNPVFNETFEWAYNTSTSKLYISVWDKDDMSTDDLVGCITIDTINQVPIMKDLRLTLPILNPKIRRKVRESTLTIIVKKMPVGTADSKVEASANPTATNTEDVLSYMLQEVFPEES